MIHSTAIISDSANIAENVEIGPYSIIGDHVYIGAGTKIESHVVVKSNTSIGESNHIFQFASIGDDPQDKKYNGEITTLTIGDRNTIREYCTINRGTIEDSGNTIVGNDNWIMAYCHIAHDCIVGNKVIMANGTTLAGHVHLGDWVICGGHTGIHQFCKVGEHAFLGMYSSINRDVPAYILVSGKPAEPKGINTEGLKRRGFSKDQVRNIKEAYRLIYRKGLKLSEAIKQIESALDKQKELLPLHESLITSDRGIVR
ncbi:MAG: acyl-[acyl-carrier-protein]--UDP-N-acetylglucosamine O-acyltransferase [Woeseia sp.]|nr:acyl-[acyl-carrier-protein]--UDP-N-acetylglucosamine O-acyltransferase [Woeseia sp.]|tara:strand:+ start:10478 stop:11248 length:771 start_codon:yes stop_codon:yes gene_type:complete